MGKSNKKFKKKEKAKVKLKGSKTLLPKGQNLTDTNFKVKKILIKDQLKPHGEGELLTTRKLSAQDLLSRLSHHNVNVRKESLEGLNELISNYPLKEIQPYFSLILQNLAKSILDLIGTIRKETIKVVATVLSKAQGYQLEPFFPSLSSYLICGLTHIDSAIREDCLYFLDILLKYAPKLCVQSVSRILPVCLDLVSQKDSVNRTLSLNLNSSLTSLKWREKVLNRIRILLKTLLENINSSSNEKMEVQDEDIVIPNKRKCYPHFFEINKYCVSKLQLDCISRSNETTIDFSIEGFSETVIPLLIDIYVESVPQKEDNVGLNAEVCTLITQEDASILQNIVEIIQILWDLLAKEENSREKLNKLAKEHRKLIIGKLIKGKFPYAMRTVQSNKKRKTSDDLTCRVQNLTLSKLVILFGYKADWVFVMPYLKSTFRAADALSNTECDIFTSCISTICQANSSEESFYFLNQVLKCVINSKNVLSDCFFTLLSNIALNRRFKIYHEEASFVSWLESLPKLLTKPKLSSSVLEKICQIAIRQFVSFSVSLDVHIEVILDNIPRIQVEGMNPEKARMKIASLLYYVNEWDEDLVNGLNKAAENEYWGPVITNYIKNIIALK